MALVLNGSGITSANIADGTITTDDILASDVSSLKSGRKNLIINGDMQVAQRGTSFTSNGYSLDRWKFYNSGGTFTASQVSNTSGALPAFGLTKAFQIVRSSPSGVLYTTQLVEDVTLFDNVDITISFYAKADASVGLPLRISQVFGSGGSANVSCGSQNASLTTTWQKFSLTYTCPSISGKTIGANNHLEVTFDIPATTDTFQLTGVQLEVGSVATDFEHRIYGEELALCQSYYEILEHSLYYNPQDRVDIHYCQRKRTTASVTLSGTYSGDCSISDNGPTGFVAIPNGAHGYMAVRWQADAEL
ncbi:MAG: hypothetical protein K0U20_08140 [Proteobacteria bacterium]|nr:hypothetical protein [Pseudomonadota bacterium]